jgi:hypothetical protein
VTRIKNIAAVRNTRTRNQQRKMPCIPWKVSPTNRQRLPLVPRVFRGTANRRKLEALLLTVDPRSEGWDP